MLLLLGNQTLPHSHVMTLAYCNFQMRLKGVGWDEQLFAQFAI